MIEILSKKIGDIFVKNEVVTEENRNVYEYGVELLISTMLSTIMVLGIGMIAGCFVQTIFILLPFYCIRIYAGGYHAENYRKCFISFCCGFIVVLFVTERLIANQAGGRLMLLELLAVLVIWKTAPVEDHSRPLDEEERILYRKKARWAAVSFCVVSELMYFWWKMENAVYISAAMNAVCLVLVIGIIKNKIIGFDI